MVFLKACLLQGKMAGSMKYEAFGGSFLCCGFMSTRQHQGSEKPQKEATFGHLGCNYFDAKLSAMLFGLHINAFETKHFFIGFAPELSKFAMCLLLNI